MCADGVEVAQQHNVPFVIADIKVGEYLLEHRLGLAIRIGGRVLRAIFRDGDEFRFAVNGGTARKHDVLHTMSARDVAQDERASNIVPVVLERFRNAFANRLEACEMDDGIDVPGGEYMLEDFAIEDRAFDERAALFVNVCYGANALDGFGRRV